MDLDSVVEILVAVRWPLVVLLAILIVRRDVFALVRRLLARTRTDHSARFVSDVEFASARSALAMSARSEGNDSLSVGAEILLEQARVTLRVSPAAAVLIAWSALEFQVRHLASTGRSVEDSSPQFVDRERLVDSPVVPRSLEETFRSLWDLRDVAASSLRRNQVRLAYDGAARYVDLVRNVAAALVQQGDDNPSI